MKLRAVAGIGGLILVLITFNNISVAAEQKAGGPSAEELAKANNPLANANAINFQNYYGSPLYGLTDQTNDTFLLRPVVVHGRQIIRATLPVNTVPSGSSSISGLGDLNIFDAIVLSPDGAKTQYGVGPLLVAPTASKDETGQGKWQAGAAAVYVSELPAGSMLAGLVTWQKDFAGDDNRQHTNFLTAQPIAVFQVGGGFYLRSSGLWTRDFENNRTLIPFGVGAGKVFRMGKTVVNAFAEPQFTIYHKGDGQPAWQLFSGINLQWFK